MAKTKFILEADQAKAVSAFLKVVEAQDKTARGLKNINREGKKTKQTLDGFGKVASDVGKMAAGFLSAQGAIAGVRKIMQLLIAEFEDLKRKQEDAARATMDYAKDFINIIGTWLGPSQIDRAHEALTRMVKEIPQLSYAQGRAMLGAFGAAVPAAGLERGIEAVRLAAPVTWERRPELMKFVGELVERFPEKKMEDIFDIAIELRQKAGKNIDLLSASMKGMVQLMEYGIEGEQALGTMMAMIERELKPRGITTMVGLIARPIEPIAAGRGRRLTERQRIQNQLAAMTPAERFRWMQQYPEQAKLFYGTTFAPIAPIFQPGAIAAGTEMVRGAQVGDAYQRAVEAAGRQRLVRRVTLEEEQVAGVEWQRMTWGRGAAAGMARRYTREMLETMPGIGATRRKMILGALEIEGLFGGDYTRAAAERLERIRQPMLQPTTPRRLMQTGWGGGEWVGGKPSPFYDPAAAEAIARLIDRITRMAETYEEESFVEVIKENTQALKEHTAALQGAGIGNLNAGLVD